MNTSREIRQALDNQSIAIAQVMEGSLSPLATTSSNINEKSNTRPNVLECFICMEAPIDPVTSTCGHVFCWPCIYTWLQKDQDRPKRPCPVCRHNLVRDRDIIPLYGAGACVGPNNNNTQTCVGASNIPLRPNNPLLSAGSQPIQGSIHLPGFVFIPSTGRSVNELTDQLIEERIRGHNMHINQATLQLQVNDLEERNAEISFARDRDVVHMYNLQERNFELVQEVEESRKRELDNNYERIQMAEHIAWLQEQLELANSMLSPGTIND